MKNLIRLPILLAIIFLSCNQPQNPELLAEKVNSEESFYESMEMNRQWPGYRGYFASGYLDQTNLPDSFNLESSHNIKWNIQIPGLGLSCFDARSGEAFYHETVNPSSFVACPVISDNRIYMVSEDGDLYIAATGKEYKLLKKIPLGEVSLVTPGIAEGMLILRTASRLIAVSSS